MIAENLSSFERLSVATILFRTMIHVAEKAKTTFLYVR